MRAKIVWIGIIVGLLSMSIIIYGVGIILAVTDPSFALEPEYEKKADEFQPRERFVRVEDSKKTTVVIKYYDEGKKYSHQGSRAALSPQKQLPD